LQRSADASPVTGCRERVSGEVPPWRPRQRLDANTLRYLRGRREESVCHAAASMVAEFSGFEIQSFLPLRGRRLGKRTCCTPSGTRFTASTRTGGSRGDLRAVRHSLHPVYVEPAQAAEQRQPDEEFRSVTARRRTSIGRRIQFLSTRTARRMSSSTPSTPSISRRSRSYLTSDSCQPSCGRRGAVAEPVRLGLIAEIGIPTWKRGLPLFKRKAEIEKMALSGRGGSGHCHVIRSTFASWKGACCTVSTSFDRGRCIDKEFAEEVLKTCQRNPQGFSIEAIQREGPPIRYQVARSAGPKRHQSVARPA